MVQKNEMPTAQYSQIYVDKNRPGSEASGLDRYHDPFALFERWFHDAEKSEPSDANAMTLATVDPSGFPNARVMLLKEFSPSGFAFYTNVESTKGQEIRATKKAALCFHWKSTRRQVRIRGTIENVKPGEADTYFATRPYKSRIGAWASKQSRPLTGRSDFEDALVHYESVYRHKEVPRPPYWSGFRLQPNEMEFWADREFRLHDRVLFKRRSEMAAWSKTLLYP